MWRRLMDRDTFSGRAARQPTLSVQNKLLNQLGNKTKDEKISQKWYFPLLLWRKFYYWHISLCVINFFEVKCKNVGNYAILQVFKKGTFWKVVHQITIAPHFFSNLDNSLKWFQQLEYSFSNLKPGRIFCSAQCLLFIILHL